MIAQWYEQNHEIFRQLLRSIVQGPLCTSINVKTSMFIRLSTIEKCVNWGKIIDL